MFAKLKKFLFGLPSVEALLSDISAKVAKLHLVADIHTAEAALHAEEIKVRTQLLADSQAVVARAKSVAAKFEALIS